LSDGGVNRRLTGDGQWRWNDSVFAEERGEKGFGVTGLAYIYRQREVKVVRRRKPTQPTPAT
jgi:hypothetical protein